MRSQLILVALLGTLSLSGCLFNTSDSKQKDEEWGKMHLLWEYAYDLDGGAPKVKPLIYEDKIITSGDIKITALDYKNGELIWKTPFENLRQLTNNSFGILSNIIVGSKVHSIQAWDIVTGVGLWEAVVPESLSFNFLTGITANHDGFIAPSDGYKLYKISPEGDISIIQLDARTYESTYSDGFLYVGQRIDGDGVLSAYDAQTMRLSWRNAPKGISIPALVAPIIENDIVYIGTTYGTEFQTNAFFALDARTGEEIWRREGIMTFSAVLHEDYLYINDAAGIFKLRKSDGGTEWYADFNAGAGTAPIAYGYGYIYAPHSGNMHVVDAETGEIVYKFSPPHGSYFWLVSAEVGRIFAQSNSHLYAFASWGHTEALAE